MVAIKYLKVKIDHLKFRRSYNVSSLQFNASKKVLGKLNLDSKELH